MTVVKVFDLHEAHPRIQASDWRSPLIHALLNGKPYKDGHRNVRELVRRKRRPSTDRLLRLEWSDLSDDYRARVNTYQGHVLTEHAALAVACILVQRCLRKEITEVTRRGDRADYWLGEKEALLEVSGQRRGSLDRLLQEKSEQLLANPFSKNGYVCVFSCSEARAILAEHSGGQ